MKSCSKGNIKSEFYFTLKDLMQVHYLLSLESHTLHLYAEVANKEQNTSTALTGILFSFELSVFVTLIRTCTYTLQEQL